MTDTQHLGTLHSTVDERLLELVAAAHQPDEWAVSHGVDLHGDPNLVGNDGRVTIPMRRAASARKVAPGQSVVLGSTLGRWRASVVAWGTELGEDDPDVVLDHVEPIGS